MTLRTTRRLFGMALASACISAPAVAATSELVPVVASLTTNSPNLRALQNMKVILASQQGKSLTRKPPTPHVLARVKTSISHETSLLIGHLPPGEYVLDEFVTGLAQGHLVPEDNRLGTFTVEAGKPVDLGRILLVRLNGKSTVGRAKSGRTNQALLRRWLPAQATLLTGTVSGGWNDAGAKPQALEDEVRAKPAGADCPSELPDGRVGVASRLGAVLMRSNAGQWNPIYGPGLENLLCVTPVNLPNAELLVVGEVGTLLRKPPGSDALLPIDTGNLPVGNLIQIAGNADYGWVVANHENGSVTFYHSKTLEAGSWTPIRTQAKVGANLNSNAFWMWRTKNGLAYTLRAGPIRHLDFGTGQWSERAVPTDVSKVVASPTGEISILARSGDVHLSRDEGATWQPIKARKTAADWPVLLTHSGHMLMPTLSHWPTGLNLSKDGGATWTVIRPFVKQRTVLPLKSGVLLDFGARNAAKTWIGSSKDNGVNWSTDYALDLGTDAEEGGETGEE